MKTLSLPPFFPSPSARRLGLRVGFFLLLFSSRSIPCADFALLWRFFCNSCLVARLVILLFLPQIVPKKNKRRGGGSKGSGKLGFISWCQQGLP
ncbi:hypothetical protein J3E72DRAFT_359705 [Bipolaris maydis]|uniref:uncharacterized protein n=1 Tax=Cochliobolus heterostrophus TaxID=5016 RepID=UPI0024D785AA|nr:hypothetical protein J3E73DRAFT_351261 [Bipolaris maydis]KAJ5055637.1 hypothetical protein J3E74DRAFT_380875 [Bipolaris maydis]KAJ6192996.1 hypothetical protein J3E72DRAFT_359705 [Bipolaris maydis]KAJ6204269.1 hypothetical protein PSV09DRAFT_2349924 [Bipolaris maydis]KAJ6265811.1 hypothetical protein PSV08DRAFT_339481 [Bipolaris maydis]